MSRYLTITDAARALRAGQTTAVELVQQASALSEAVEGRVESFLTRFRDSALTAGEHVDARLSAGEDPEPLAGIPVGIKDNISTGEAPSTAQSLVLDPAWGAGAAAAVVRLRAAGAVIMGKLTMMEFAIGVPDPSRPFPIPRNPWSLDRWAGGSSSGSASAVATGTVLGALGTDTGGSIRIPAAFCGVTGLKPTFGRVPKSGCVPLGYTLDHVGPLARSARDCALLVSVLAGHHPEDPQSIHSAVPTYLDELTGDLSGTRVGVDLLGAAAGDGIDASVPAVLDEALNVLRSRGARIVPVELPLYAELTTVCNLTLSAEALAYHRSDLRERWSDYAVGTRAIVGAGVFYSAADYVQAQPVRQVGAKKVAELFRDVDVLVTPTVSGGAPTFDELPTKMRSGFRAAHTSYWNTVGNPVLSVPMGSTSSGLPLGMQVIGRPLDEASVLRLGDAFQQATDWHLMVPPVVADLFVAAQSNKG